ncbi:hypothetical protein D3C85_1232010 [compost metagenome]
MDNHCRNALPFEQAFAKLNIAVKGISVIKYFHGNIKLGSPRIKETGLGTEIIGRRENIQHVLENKHRIKERVPCGISRTGIHFNQFIEWKIFIH